MPAPPAADAGPDVSRPKPKDAGADTADTAPVYVPLGTKCVRDPDAGIPSPFVAPLADGGDASVEGGADPILPQVVSTKDVATPLPLFVPVTYDSDELRPQIEDFIASVGCTTWWRAVAPDYGVADGVSGDPVHVSEQEPGMITDAQIQTWIKSKIGDGSFPKPTRNTVYAIFYPSNTTVQASFGKGCFSFGAYHSYFAYQGNWIGYAIMPRCADLNALTEVTSHELIEAVSDPAPGGYQDVGPRNVAWSLFGGSEVGDMCEHASSANYQPSDYAFPLQRAWSNKAAFSGHNPCLPADSPNWFVAAPVLSDTVTVNYYGMPTPALGLKLAAGNQTTIDVRMLSDGPTSGWNVSAQDLSQWTIGKTVLKFAFDKTQGIEGDVLKLTVTRSGTNQNYGADPFFIRSTSGSAEHLWFGVVGD